ncbi:MAG: glycosyltransferase family 2 protein [Acidobacteriota bacterium]
MSTAPSDPSTPRIAFIVPTLDEGQRLGRCLRSVREQDYPADRVEILIADGGSRDATLDIARAAACRLVDAAGLLAEAAKERALEQVHEPGREPIEIVVFLDADNTILDRGWLRRVVDALAAHPEALGFESYYAAAPGDPPLNRYLTELLQISDPWARSVARRPRRIGEEADGLERFELPADGAYPTGANGFALRRELLADDDGRPFHEATFFPHLIRGGRRLLLKHPAARVHHDYVRGWRDFFRKKQRVALHYLLRREEVSGAWDADLPTARRWLAMLYCASGVGPTVEGLLRFARTGRPEWLLHGPASFVAVVATLAGIARSIGSRPARRERSRRLKPGRPPRPGAQSG